MAEFDAARIGALVFDVFGTVVDWRGSIVREGEALAARKRLKVDWPAFADAWRAGYRPAMERIGRGEAGWASIDVVHRQILTSLVPRFGLEALTEADLDDLNRAWHRLSPWPDAVAGLTRLKSRFVIATLSNGNVSLLVAMARHAGLPWDCVLSAELVKKYKPDPAVYRMAAELLGFDLDRVLMVAAHADDLDAAARVGLRTAYVARPLEHGPNAAFAPPGAGRFDLAASDFVDLAQRLGA
ncbi:MAG: haloacid dehalogenase type II [Caldimonas sp.]